MKIQYNGTDAVDIPGVDGVEPGSIVEVDDEVGASLLLAGTSIDADGVKVAPVKPLWTAPKNIKPAADVAGKDTP